MVVESPMIGIDAFSESTSINSFVIMLSSIICHIGPVSPRAQRLSCSFRVFSTTNFPLSSLPTYVIPEEGPLQSYRDVIKGLPLSGISSSFLPPLIAY